MIKSDKLKEMKKVLGHGYPLLLVEKLNKKRVLNSKGLPISANYVRQIFNGRINNIEVLSIIIDDYKAQKRKITKTIKRLT